MSGEVPDGWQALPLSTQAEIIMGQSPRSEDTNQDQRGIPFFQGNGEFGTKHPQANRWIEAPLKTARRGDILFSVRAPVGEMNIADVDCCIGRGLCAIRARHCDPSFLFQALSFSRGALAAVSQGSTFAAVNKGDLGEREMLFPPLPEQHRIAEILSSVDEAIQAAQAVIEQMVDVEQGVLQRLLTKGIDDAKYVVTEIGSIPSGWEVRSIAEICTLSNGNGFRPPDWSNSGLPIIRIQNLNGSTKFNYFSGNPKPKWVINPGDLLFSWAGVKGVSFGPHLWSGPQGVLNQHIFKVAPKKDIHRQWLYHVMRFVTARIEAKAHGFKDTLLHVHKGDILNQLVAVPPPSEQAQIVERLSAFSHAIINERKQLAALIQIKSALMAELLTGRRRVAASLPLAAE